jgi:flagellar hook-length control protein FliK
LDISQIGYSKTVVKTSDGMTSASDSATQTKNSLFSEFLAAKKGTYSSLSGESYGSQTDNAAGDSGQDAYKRYQYKDNGIGSAAETSIQDKAESLSDKTERLTSEVVKTVSEDLDVPEEDVENAMETLGLTVFDLADPQNLAELVKTVTGMTDNTQVLLNPEFVQTLTDVSGLVDTFAKENNLTGAILVDFAAEYAKLQDTGEETALQMTAADAVAAGESDGQQSEAAAGTAEDLTDESSAYAAELSQETEQPVSQTEDSGAVGAEEASWDKTVVEDNRTSQKKESVVTGQEETSGDTSQEQTGIVREKEETGGREDSFSSGKQDGEDVSRQMTASVNETVAEVADTAESSETPAYTEIDVQDIIDQIVEQTKVVFDNDSTTIEMQLNPENLGKIFLNISSKEGTVSAQLFAQNEAVRAALETQIATLTENLNQAGVKVDAIEVSVATHEFERNLEQNAKGGEEQGSQEEEKRSRRRSLRMDSLDDLSGLMSEEEALAAQIMKDNGNSVDFTA